MEVGVEIGNSAQDPVLEGAGTLQNKKAFLFLALKGLYNLHCLFQSLLSPYLDTEVVTAEFMLVVIDDSKMVEAAFEQSKSGENISFSVLFSCSFNKILNLLEKLSQIRGFDDYTEELHN